MKLGLPKFYDTILLSHLQLFEHRSKWVKPDENGRSSAITTCQMKKVTENQEMEGSLFIASPGGAMYSSHSVKCQIRGLKTQKKTPHIAARLPKRTVGTPSMRRPPRSAPRWALDEVTCAALSSDHEDLASHSGTDIDHDQDSATSSSTSSC